MKICYLFLLVLFWQKHSYSQCEDAFSQNNQKNNYSLLTTKACDLSSDKGIHISVQFNKSNEGISATVAIVGDSLILMRPIKGNDKLMFISSTGERKAYEFINENKYTITHNQLPKYSNVAKLDLKTINWLSENIILQIRFVNFQEMKMYPYFLNEEQQKELKNISNCFFKALKYPKIKGQKLKNSEILFASKNSFIDFRSNRDSYVGINTDNSESLKGDYFSKVTTEKGVLIASFSNNLMGLESSSGSKNDDRILIDNFPITVLIEYKVEGSNEWIKASVKLYQGGELRITLQK